MLASLGPAPQLDCLRRRFTPCSCLQTQKMFGNKWNDIANYLPMRCNNDIKNHFNLYLKDKQASVSLENSYLRADYDLPGLLAAEPEDVATRRQKLEKERVSRRTQQLRQPCLNCAAGQAS
eukprot:GHRQ01031708.1.p2 GENE.GHRQ01031708.1~~GHRQ01031708.1.p2  ORF type:complete len:121 (+),score=41.41 GHRQ01031708.1:590-952(+)